MIVFVNLMLINIRIWCKQIQNTTKIPDRQLPKLRQGTGTKRAYGKQSKQLFPQRWTLLPELIACSLKTNLSSERA